MELLAKIFTLGQNHAGECPTDLMIHYVVRCKNKGSPHHGNDNFPFQSTTIQNKEQYLFQILVIPQKR